MKRAIAGLLAVTALAAGTGQASAQGTLPVSVEVRLDAGLPMGDFDDVVKTLDDLQPDDWNTFLRDRLDGRKPLTGGIDASGWRLVFKDTPNAYAKAAAAEYGAGSADFVYSLGLSVSKDNTITNVRWDSPAFQAGIGPGMTAMAVNGRAYGTEVMEDAIKAAKANRKPIELLVKEFDTFRTIQLPYYEGLRYPHLERIDGKPDRLAAIYAAKK